MHRERRLAGSARGLLLVRVHRGQRESPEMAASGLDGIELNTDRFMGLLVRAAPSAAHPRCIRSARAPFLPPAPWQTLLLAALANR